MKSKNKFILGMCSLIITSSICGCGIIEVKQEKMYDDNAKIAEEYDSYTYRERAGKSEPDNKFEMSYGSFSGTDTIWTIDVKKDTEITFDYNSSVNKGDAKAVLIYPDNKIENIFEGNDKSNKVMKLSKGKYRVKFVGKNARGKVKINIDKSDNFKVKKDEEWN